MLRDAMKKTWQRNLATNPILKAESADDAGVADSSFNAVDDELSAGSNEDEDKENKRANMPSQSRKRKAHIINLDSSEDEAKPATAKNTKRLRRIRSNVPTYDWDTHFKEEREARSRFEKGLMEMLEGSTNFMKTAHEDNCAFQNSLLDILRRKL